MTGAIQGFVLAGGGSRRFGSDKGLALYRGRSLVQWALRAFDGLDLTPRVVTRNPSAYPGIVSAFVIGESAGGGPVEGLRASLASTTAPWSLVVSVDMPGVDRALLDLLVEGRGAEDSIRPVVFHGAERVHPFPGLYPTALLPTLEGLSPGSSMYRLLEVSDAVRLGEDRLPGGSEPARIFRNVNRPEDLQDPLQTGPESD